MYNQKDNKKVFAVYANALANDLNYRIQFRNVSTASFGVTNKGEQIMTLPNLPAEMTEEEIAKFLGLTAHEIEHKNSTEMSLMGKAIAIHQLMGQLLNVFEDIRIEGNFGRKHVGGRLIINNMASALAHEGFYGHPGPNTNPASVITQFILQRLNVDLLGQPLKSYADSWEQAFEQTFNDEVKTQIRAVMSQANTMGSTQCAYDLSEKVLNILMSASQQPNESDDSEDEQESNGSSESNGSEDEQESNGSSESNGSEDEQESNIKFDAKAIEALEVEQGDIESSEKSELLNAKNIGLDNSQLSTVHSSNGEELFDALPKRRLIDDARMESNALIQQLTALLQNQNARQGKKKTQFGKRLNSRAMVSAVAGNHSHGIYSKKAKGAGTQSDIHILIDASDSMNEGIPSPINVAIKTAMSLMMALQRIPNIKLGVSAFTNAQGKSCYHHNVDVSNFEQGLEALSRINYNAMWGTPLAEGLVGAISSMNLNHYSDKRILFVIQDGGGMNDMSRKALEMAKNNDIKVVGIGINHDLTGFYDYSINIRDTADLKTQFFTLMRTELMSA